MYSPYKVKWRIPKLIVRACTAQKMIFSIKDFFGKFDLTFTEECLAENFVFCAVTYVKFCDVRAVKF